jgi:hypothetical protein
MLDRLRNDGWQAKKKYSGQIDENVPDFLHIVGVLGMLGSGFRSE